MDSVDIPPSWSLVRDSAHPYFTTAVVETCHALSEAAQSKLMMDETITPGLDGCCAVCCMSSEKFIVCSKCERVSFCGPRHQASDPCHAKVCRLLSLLNAADKAEALEDQLAALISKCLTAVKDKENLRDWTDVYDGLPELKSVWLKSVKDRKENFVSLAAKASSYLSYPLTALQQILSFPLDSSSGHFTILCLGASEEAELHFPDVWSQAFASKIRGEVTIQFVGPDVPVKMHKKARKEGSVTLVGWRGTIEGLMKEKDTASLPQSLLSIPDFCLGFNMGLTCPDYDWVRSLKSLKRRFKDSSAGDKEKALVIISTSNTYVEGCMEGEVWEELGYMDMKMDNVESNPFTSLEVLQSGTLGNDVYRKNAWVSCYGLVKKAAKSSDEKGTKKKGREEKGRAGEKPKRQKNKM
jgi:hypothetical protein